MFVMTLNDKGVVFSCKEVLKGYVLRVNEYEVPTFLRDKLGLIYDPINNTYTTPEKEPITVLTVGSMQSRFSVDEEIAVLTGTDEYAKVFHTRLMNAKCADLNNQELQYGVSHIVYYLDSIGRVQDGVSVPERISKLFEDGTEDEKYLGV